MLFRILIGAAIAFGASSTMLAGVFASSDLDWKSELKPELCGGIGKPIVNVRQVVWNDIDSGIAGYWAFDKYRRDIKVWKTAVNGTFCATVHYKGKFNAIPGATSPGNTATLLGDEKGKMEGGYRATIVGEFNPTLKTKGSIGLFDYDCDVSANCPGRVDWIAKYFTETSTSLDWWGWIYRGGKYGTWVNAVIGNEGDITPATKKGHNDDEEDDDEEDDD